MIQKDIVIGLLLHEGRLLIIERKDENPLWNKKWEFPGGKIEQGEDPACAFLREVKEETGIDAKEPEFLGNHTHDWTLADGSIFRVHLHCFLSSVSEPNVVLEPNHASSYTWIEPQKIEEWDLLEANADLTKKLLWPRLGF